MEIGKLHIKRINQSALGNLKVHVFVDGKYVLDIARNEIKELALPDGKHVIYAKVGWLKAKAIEFFIHAGEVKYLELGSPVPGTKANHYLTLGMLIFLAGLALSKFFQNDLFFWAGIGINGLALVAYLYFIFGKLEHLYLKEVCVLSK